MIDEWFLKPFQELALQGPRRLAIDVGANLGEWSRWMALHFDQVVALEPDHHALSQFREAGVPGKCAILPVACGREHGVQTYYVRGMSQQSSLCPEHPIGGADQSAVETIDTRPITVVTLDQIAEMFQHTVIDFVKIDVEGSEGDVLGGIRGPAFRHARLIIEVHDKRDEVGAELQRLGYGPLRIQHHPFEGAHPNHLWLFVPPLEPQ